MEFMLIRITSYNVCYTKLLRMLPVFLISIGVADSIHFLAEYRQTGRTAADSKPVAKVLGRLWKPMLMTSLTTMGGFLSLTWTPIP